MKLKKKEHLQGINGRMDDAENQVNDLEYKEAKTKQSEEQEEKKNAIIIIIRIIQAASGTTSNIPRFTS